MQDAEINITTSKINLIRQQERRASLRTKWTQDCVWAFSSSIRKLRVHCDLLRNELILTAQVIDTVDNNHTGDHSFIRFTSFQRRRIVSWMVPK